MQKLLGQNAALRGRSLQLGFERSAGMALNRHTRARPCGSRFRRNAAELDAGSSKFAMVNLGAKLKFHFAEVFAMKNVGKPFNMA